MTYSGSVRVLLFIGSNLLLLSYKACEEGAAHDSYGSVPGFPDSSPPFLGIAEWISIGIFLFVVASGFIVSAVMVTEPYRRAVDHLVVVTLSTPREMQN